jgi:hypothetical protein
LTVYDSTEAGSKEGCFFKKKSHHHEEAIITRRKMIPTHEVPIHPKQGMTQD